MPAISSETTLPAARGERVVEVYDFRRPTTLAREHSRVLEVAFDTFARQWGTQLTAKIRATSQVVAESVSMASYDEYAASLPDATAMVLWKLEGHEAKGVIQFPAESALQWVTRMLGGAAGAAIPDRKFTQIEQTLIRRLMEDALEDLRYSFGSVLESPVGVDTMHFNSQFAQAAATNTLMVVAVFSIRVGEHSCRATLAVPAEALLPQLGATNPMTDAADAEPLIRAQLANVPVDVALELAPASVLPATILNLAVGDVLELPHPKVRPFDLTVGGKPIARAAGVTHGSRRAGQIVDTEESTA